jgi:NAD(P)-dependent dehydrogenase (short-subunit alcohol dehydrogenase family)
LSSTLEIDFCLENLRNGLDIAIPQIHNSDQGSHFTRWLAVHMSKVNIRVNAIAPGFFLTDQNRALLTNADGSLTARGKTIIAHTPMGKFGDPEDLVGALLWLADNKGAGFVNGTVIPVDGAFSAFSGV